MSLIVELTTATDTVRRRIRDLLLASPVTVVSESQPVVPVGNPPTLWFKTSTGTTRIWVDGVWSALGEHAIKSGEGDPNGSQATGVLDLAPTYMAGNFVENDTVTVGSNEYVFVIAPTGPYQIPIGEDFEATLASFITDLEGTSDPAVTASYGGSGNLTVTTNSIGSVGNSSVTEADLDAGGIWLAPTLSGGFDPVAGDVTNIYYRIVDGVVQDIYDFIDDSWVVRPKVSNIPTTVIRTRNNQGYPSDTARYILQRTSGPYLPTLLDGFLFYMVGYIENPIRGQYKAYPTWGYLRGDVTGVEPDETMSILLQGGAGGEYRWKCPSLGSEGGDFVPDETLVGNLATQNVRLQRVDSPGVLPSHVGQLCVVGSEIGEDFAETFIATGMTKASWHRLLTEPDFYEVYE